MKFTEIPVEDLRAAFNYSTETGEFTWRITSGSRAKPGFLAGAPNPVTGYWSLSLNGSRVLAHRAAWAIAKGVWPKSHIDHINRERSDNRMCNLREATREQNGANSLANKNNHSGYKGATYIKQMGKFASRIMVKGKNLHLGFYETPIAANRAYLEKKKELFGEFVAE